MTKYCSTTIFGLLLALASSANAFAPTMARPVAKLSTPSSSSSSTSTKMNVGAVFEDKPHMMIGGRGYSHLLVDMTEFEEAKAAMARRKKKQAAKLIAGYTAVVAGALLLRQLTAFVPHLGYYYKAFPMTAAMATCGIKSLVADAISQVKAWTGEWEWKRSFSGLLYGAFVLGAGSKTAYKFLPTICPPGVAGIAASCAIDNFLLAPLFWLPGAYVVKALLYRFSVKQAIQDYVSDIKEHGLLGNYWKLWVPAQFVNFAVVPKHLQVAWVAGVGFLWYFVLSTTAFKEEDETD